MIDLPSKFDIRPVPDDFGRPPFGVTGGSGAGTSDGTGSDFASLTRLVRGVEAGDARLRLPPAGASEGRPCGDGWGACLGDGEGDAPDRGVPRTFQEKPLFAQDRLLFLVLPAGLASSSAIEAVVAAFRKLKPKPTFPGLSGSEVTLRRRPRGVLSPKSDTTPPLCSVVVSGTRAPTRNGDSKHSSMVKRSSLEAVMHPFIKSMHDDGTHDCPGWGYGGQAFTLRRKIETAVVPWNASRRNARV
mmetsp:Transcript_27081/g.59956  ORF Transcript_27081/g.59956 Transcript_27081/m.59956 type:complete len:244 (-) Transcript_27081:104-835(-)